MPTSPPASLCAKPGAKVGVDLVSVMAWLDGEHPFRKRYARARDLQADLISDDILYIADAAEGAGAGDSARQKLRIEARKFVLTYRSERRPVTVSPRAAPATSPQRPIIKVVTGVPRAGE